MKTQLLVIVSYLFLAAGVHGQAPADFYKVSRQSGIYLSADDYQHGKLTLPVHCETEQSRVRMNDFLGKPHVTVIHQGKKHTFLKDSLFGLRTCEGHDFRFFHRRLFEIEELKTIVIYRHMTIESGGGNKNVRQVAKYYFSTGVGSAIMPLTRPALERTFPHNEKLHDLLDAWFHGNRDAISTYDSYYHTFKINRVLQAAI